MAKIQIGAKFITDGTKTDPQLNYEFVPKLSVPAGPKGRMVANDSLPKGEGIVIEKKYITAGEKSSLRMKFEAAGTVMMPMTEVWNLTVTRVRNLWDDKGEAELSPADIANAVGSTLADALIVENYHDSMGTAELTEDEQKN